MPEADRCSLNVPFPYWARDNPNQPELDSQNWLEVMRWADRYHREQCGGGGGAITIDLGETVPGTGYSRVTYPLVDASFDSVVGSLSVAGSTDTIAEVVKWDGTVATSIATITIPANTTYATADVGVDFAETDGWQMRITQAGTGAEGLSYHGKFG